MSGQPEPRAAQRLDIQGLRMLAVGSVVVNHLWGQPAGGFVGVDVFFVVSGFLITGLMLREHDRNGRISMLDFYRRRFKRLMPAASLTLAATLVVGALALPYTRAIELAWDTLFAAVFVANWRFAATETDYFQAGQTPSALQHYWSLSVEEQFYVVWPLVIIAILWVAAKAGASAAGRNRALLAAILVVTLASLAWATWETANSPEIAYFSTLSRGWELGIGATLAIVLHLTRRRLPVAAAVVLSYFGIAGIVLSWFWVDPEQGFPMPFALLPVLATAAVLFAGADASAVYSRSVVLLTNRVSTYIGDISYSLYLWHFPVIILLPAFIAPSQPWFWVLALIMMLVLSVASYHLVENPARRSPWLTSRWSWTPRRSATVALAVVAALATLVSTQTALSNPRPSPALADVASADCQGADALVNDCTVDDLTGATTPSIDDLTEDNGAAFDCWRYEGDDWRDCSIDQDGGSLRVAVIGDSHAAMYLTALDPLADAQGWQLDRYVGYGCQWLQGYDYRDCAPHLEQLQERLTDEDPYDLIITSAARWAFEDEDDPTEAYAETWREVIEQGTQVMVIEDVTTFTETAFQCVARVGFSAATTECDVPLERAQQPADPLPAAAEIAGADLIRVQDLICDGEVCPASIGGVVVFRDAVGHLSDTYVRTLAPHLQERVLAALR